MIPSFWRKLSTMNVSLRVPSAIGLAWNPGAAMIVKSGTWRRACSTVEFFRNIVRAKRLCHAFWVTMRTARRWSGSAPP